MRFGYATWLRLTPYFLGGFGCFLSYLLMLRLGRVQYVFQYVPYTSNPVLFTPLIDIALWIAATGALSSIALSVYWHRHKRCRVGTLVALTSAVIFAGAIALYLNSVIPWLVPLSCLPLLYLLYEPLGHLDRGRCFQASAYAVIGIWLLIQVGSAVFQILFIRGIYPFPIDIERQIISLSIDLMYALQGCSVSLLFTVGFSWITIPLFLIACAKKHFPISLPINKTWTGYAILLTSIVLSAAAVTTQYIRYPELRGVDAMYYVDRLTLDLDTLLRLLPADPRIVYVIFLKCLTFLGATTDLSFKFGSLILMGLNACAFYVLGEEIVGDRFGGGLVAVFSALGLQTAVSLYAGIYANWLSLPLAACAFAFYLRAIRTKRTIFFFFAGLFVVASLLTHPWTGLEYSLILVSACVLDSVSSRRSGWHFLFAELVLAFSVCLVILLAYLCAPYAGMMKTVLSLSSSIQVSNMEQLTSNLKFTMDYMVGGFMSVPYYVLGLVGFSGLALEKGPSSPLRLLSLWLAATFMPVIFAEQWLQWRLIYLMPIQILSGLGVYYVCNVAVHINRRERLTLLTVIACTVVLTMFNYLLVSVRFIPSV